MMTEWIQYQPEGDYIPIEQWGRDHWSTFVYLETVAVDKQGIVSNPQMRCSPRLHREFAHSTLEGVVDGGKYPTRLKTGEISDHDDWSCLEDMVAAGLIESWFRVRRRGEMFGGSEAKVSLTLKGQEIAAKLRQHKANGGKWSDFEIRPGLIYQQKPVEEWASGEREE